MINGTYLTREAILNAEDIEGVDVSVPEWGGMIRVRMMTAAEREAYETMINDAQKADKLTNIRASLVAWCAVGADGARLFSAADVSILGTKSAVALTRLFEAARKLNGMTTGEEAEIKKNSGPTTGADSASG